MEMEIGLKFPFLEKNKYCYSKPAFVFLKYIEYNTVGRKVYNRPETMKYYLLPM